MPARKLLRPRLLARTAISLLRQAGVDPLRLVGFVRGLPGFVRDHRMFLQQQGDGTHVLPMGQLSPAIGEKGDSAGTASGHYFHQDLHVAQRVFCLKPRRHIDVGSRVDGFVAHVASFRHIEVLDIRPLEVSIPNVTFRQANLMEAPSDLLGSTDSLSSLHAIEHFGLGRYGDPLDPRGHEHAIRSLSSILEGGGVLHLSFPIGPARVEFNAQRVLSLELALTLLEPLFTVAQFSYVDDDGALVADAPLTSDVVRANAGCWLGCGIFELRKKH